jgi:hypothetical protein
MRTSARGTTWRCACGQLAAPDAVLAIYRDEGQPRQARTAGGKLARELALAARQDDMLDAITAMNRAGRIPAGSQKDAVLRAAIKNTTSLGQLDELGRALLALPRSAAPVIAGQVIHESAPAQLPDVTDDADDARRAEWGAFLRAEAAKTRYFTGPDGPAAIPAPRPGDQVAARGVRFGAVAQVCRRCRTDPARLAADVGDPTAALLADVGDTGTLSALCPACLTALQAAYPGRWDTRPLEAA